MNWPQTHTGREGTEDKRAEILGDGWMDGMIPAGWDGKDKRDDWMDAFGGMNWMENGWISEVRGQRSEDRGQRSEDRGQRTS